MPSASADQQPAAPEPSYVARRKIFPKRGKGTFRTLKWWVMFVTLGVYYITPWLRWDRGPYAPDQAVLIDLPARRFYFFFIEIWPQEFFVIAALLIMAGIGLFLLTSVAGRVWCGYTCPQTVWVDLFLVVERWIEGERNARMKLDRSPWTTDKIYKRLVKHAIWIAIAIATGGAWIFYFADAPTLLINFATLSAPYQAYIAVGVLTATTYVFGGLMREQVCIYMCPWPRIQSAMLDENSLVVTYRAWRGEPRSKHRKSTAGDLGDCVDCGLCTAVCPTGIDIRDGQQLGCITCALCIDACNEVMERVGKPRNLIAYDTLQNDTARAKGDSHLVQWPWLRIRTGIYFFLWSLIGVAIIFYLGLRDRIELNVLHDRNPLYVTLADGQIRNRYTVKILNMEPHPRSFILQIDGLPGAVIEADSGEFISERSLRVDVEPDKLKSIRFFVTADTKDATTATLPFEILIEAEDGAGTDQYDALFNTGQ